MGKIDNMKSSRAVSSVTTLVSHWAAAHRKQALCCDWCEDVVHDDAYPPRGGAPTATTTTASSFYFLIVSSSFSFADRIQRKGAIKTFKL